MNRRRYLTLGGAALSAGLTGCARVLNGSESERPEVPEYDGPLDEDEMTAVYREALSEHDLEIDHLAVGGERLIMDYQTSATTEDELLQEMGTPSFTYAEIVISDWQVEMAELWINDSHVDDPRQKVIGSYIVENEWAFDWQDGDLTDDEFMKQIVDTVEAYEQFGNRFGNG